MIKSPNKENFDKPKNVMKGLFDAPKKLNGLALSQVIDTNEGLDDLEEEQFEKPNWINNIKGTRLDAKKLSLIYSVFGYDLSHHSQATNSSHNNNKLIIVIPPISLGNSNKASLYGNISQFRRGVLMPLHSSLSYQKLLIAKEFHLPSTGGLEIFLINNDNYNDVNENEDDEPGPKVNDHCWKFLWNFGLNENDYKFRKPDINSDNKAPNLKIPIKQLPNIVGKIEFDINVNTKSGKWFSKWLESSVTNSNDNNESRQLKIKTEKPIDDSSQLPTPGANSFADKFKQEHQEHQDSPRSTSSLPYRSFELDTLQSLLIPSSNNPSHINSPITQSKRTSASNNKDNNRGSAHIMQDTLDELEKALADLSPKPIDQNQDFGQRRDAVQKAARTLSKIGNRQGFHIPRKSQNLTDSQNKIAELHDGNQEEASENSLVGSMKGYRADDEPVALPKTPQPEGEREREESSSPIESGTSSTNTSDSNNNEFSTETPATETDISRYTPPPNKINDISNNKTNNNNNNKPFLSIETNNQNPSFNIHPSSPNTAPPNTVDFPQVSPLQQSSSSTHLPSPSLTTFNNDEQNNKKLSKSSFSFGNLNLRKNSESALMMDRKNSTESKRSTKSSREGSTIEGLGIKGLKFWQTNKHNSNQVQREPSITAPIGVVKTASGGAVNKYGATSNKTNSPTKSIKSVGSHQHASSTASMIEQFPDSRYPQGMEIGDAKFERTPSNASHSIRKPSVESIHTHKTQSSTSTTSSSNHKKSFMPRKQSLDYTNNNNNKGQTNTSFAPPHSNPLPSSATFAPPSPIPEIEKLDDINRRNSENELMKLKIKEEDEILQKEREKDFEAKVEAFEAEQLASQARAKALTQQEETRRIISKEKDMDDEFEAKKKRPGKGEPGSRFSESPPPSPAKKLTAVPILSRKFARS